MESSGTSYIEYFDPQLNSIVVREKVAGGRIDVCRQVLRCWWTNIEEACRNLEECTIMGRVAQDAWSGV